MTIKKRLAISNTLMIVIPITIALVIALGSLYITWFWIKQVLPSSPQYNYSDEKILELIPDAVNSEEAMSELEGALSEYSINFIVYDEDGVQYNFGKETFWYKEELLDSLLALGVGGSVYTGDEGGYSVGLDTGEDTYTVYILYKLEYDEASDYDRMLYLRLIIVVIVTIVSIILSVIITNRFLTRFVFREIKQSLDLLSDGVRQIRDENLDYRISYEGKDEFSPVCEDFNDMAVRLHHSIELTHRQEQSRKELIAGISHDLRSPLTSIKAYVEGLLDGVAQTPQAQRNYMQMIRTKADDIDHMVSKLFLFSKMDMGDYPYYPETLDLSEELTSYLQATKEEYNAKGLQVLTEQLEPGRMIYADPIQLRSIFTNVLENSLKYKDKPDATVRILIEHYGEIVRIILEDNGPGVPEEALDKLFDVFYRSDPSRSNPNNGSGLGLAITAKAIAYMGGVIYAQNRIPSGLRIVIELPIAHKE